MEKILVVDDERILLTSLSIWLEEKGYKVDTSEAVLEALAMIEKEEYDYLLTDIKLVGLNGYNLADAVSSFSSKTKIVLMSGYDFPPGFNKYPHLTKPFKFPELLEYF